MLSSLNEQQTLLTQLVESRTELADGYEAVKSALEAEEDKRLEAEQQVSECKGRHWF